MKNIFYFLFPDGSHMNSSLSWHWSPNSTSSNFQPLESMPEMPQNNNNATTISGSKPLLSETLSMPLLPNYFSVENTEKYETHHIQNTGKVTLRALKKGYGTFLILPGTQQLHNWSTLCWDSVAFSLFAQ